VQFVKGLSEYRQGHFDQASLYLAASAQKIPTRPGPSLVLAMNQFRSGSPAEARKTLAAVMTIYDWKELHDDYTTVWTSHILRREAERLILPNLPAFLEGKYQPQDNDERLALLGACQSTGRYLAAAQLYADAFAADPALADRLASECFDRAARERDLNNRLDILKAAPRFLAARCAAAAAFGLDKAVPNPDDAQRARLRQYAQQWLAADLDMCTKSLTSSSETSRDLAANTLTLWQSHPDLAPLREPQSLGRLPLQEQAAWTALWKQASDVLTSAQRSL
jgi:serine/threonine-protein kinase